MLTKWARQLSAECEWPNWFTGFMRELVIFEIMRAYFNHPFNRYAWVVVHGADMDYYSDKVVKLGLLLSFAANLLLTPKIITSGSSMKRVL